MRNQALRALAVGAATLAAAALVGTGARAADMAEPMTAPQQFSPQPVELGTGWYLRGDIGFVSEKEPKLNAELSNGGKRANHFGASVGFGYKFNNWLRADMTYDWRNSITASGSGSAPCVTAVNSGVNTTTTCSTTSNVSLKQHAVLVNGYVDLGNWSGVSPYVGAGIGYAALRTGGSSAYTLPGGGAPSGAVVDGVTGTTYAFDYSSVISKKYNNIAWALMAGVSYDLNNNAKVDLGYRYLNSGTYNARSPVAGTISKKTADSHEVRVGIRYMIDGNGI